MLPSTNRFFICEIFSQYTENVNVFAVPVFGVITTYIAKEEQLNHINIFKDETVAFFKKISIPEKP